MDASSLSSHDDNKGPLILALTWTSISLALIVVMLRFYARATIGPKIGSDDICVGVAVVSNSQIRGERPITLLTKKPLNLDCEPFWLRHEHLPSS